MDTQLDRRPPPDSLLRHPPPQAVGLALAIMEGLLGRRSLHQLRPWLSIPAFLHLVDHVDARTFGNSRLGRLRAQMPAPTAVEATASISLGPRWLACVVRLDHRDGWLCSDVAVPGAPECLRR